MNRAPRTRQEAERERRDTATETNGILIDGQHWIVNNPNWPNGDGEHLVRCSGCRLCESP